MDEVGIIREVRFVRAAVVPLTAMVLLSFYLWLRKQESFDVHGKAIFPYGVEVRDGLLRPTTTRTETQTTKGESSLVIRMGIGLLLLIVGLMMLAKRCTPIHDIAVGLTP